MYNVYIIALTFIILKRRQFPIVFLSVHKISIVNITKMGARKRSVPIFATKQDELHVKPGFVRNFTVVFGFDLMAVRFFNFFHKI